MEFHPGSTMSGMGILKGGNSRWVEGGGLMGADWRRAGGG